MDIFNDRERKVRCICNDNDVWGEQSDARVLTVGETYTVIGIEVHSWHTLVTLLEFPNEEFNSVLFEEVA